MVTLRAAVRLLALWVTIASIAVVSSERVFWFWTPSPLSHVELALFYALPAGVAMAVIGRFQVELGWSLLLVAPVFAFVVEGVLTPIIYTGFFLPVFPAWFTWWHGVMALAIGVFLVRSWLLAERRGLVALFSIGLGCFWGLWASTLRLPENAEDPEMLADVGELVVLEPMAFARYAATFTAVFIASHLLLGMVWPDGPSRPSPLVERLLGLLVAVGVIGWTIALPWALPMFAIYLFVPWLALRWHREGRGTDPATAGADLVGQLQGRVRPAATAPLVLLAPAASLTYAGLWLLDPSDGVLRAVSSGTIAVQGLAGASLTVLAVIRVRRIRRTPTGRPPGTGNRGWSIRPGDGRPTATRGA